MNKRLHILVEGRVQGVGYRFTARDKAVILGLKGVVRNLEDGRVEIVAEGDEAKLKEMLQWCRAGPSMAHVLNVLVDWSDFEAEFHSFDVE